MPQKREVGSSLAPKGKETQSPEVDGHGEHLSPSRGNLPYQSSMWNDPNFGVINFIGVLLLFNEDFSDDYKVVCNMAFFKLFDLKENNLLRVLLVENSDRKKHAQTDNKLKSKILRYQVDLAKGEL